MSGGAPSAGSGEMDKDSRSTTNKGSENMDAVLDVRRIKGAYENLRSEIDKVIVGQDEVIEQLLISIFCQGHSVVVGVPGLAKTLLISTVARSLTLEFSRIQFTPDLMPSDITGTEVIEEDKATGRRELRFVKGPVFANVILADEINRTPPKTQAALLEAMQEHQVTAGGILHRLPEPFFVLATQNPIEQEGTYPLPEAQLDRFMFMINIGYPSEIQEMEIMKRTTAGALAEIDTVMTGEEVSDIQGLVRSVPVAEHVMRYALAIVRSTRVREESEAVSEYVRNYLSWGAGPRASQFLILAAKAKAVLSGGTHVTPEHIRKMVHPVLRHRIITNFNAEADGVNTDMIIDHILENTAVDDVDSSMANRMNTVFKST